MSLLKQPKIVCLCGSTRFKREFEEEEKRLTLEGAIVLTVGLFGHLDPEPLSGEQKAMLDELHLRKIDLADEVRVVNPGRYLGESTKAEILYALHHGVPITVLEGPRPTYVGCLRCDEEDVLPYGGAGAVREARMLGWKPVPSKGWVCPGCAEANE